MLQNGSETWEREEGSVRLWWGLQCGEQKGEVMGALGPGLGDTVKQGEGSQHGSNWA